MAESKAAVVKAGRVRKGLQPQPALALLGRVVKATDPVVGAVPRSRLGQYGATTAHSVRYSGQHACRLGARLGGFTPRDGQTQALLDKVKAVRPEGGSAVVALYDPVGMAAELAALANHRLAAFHHSKQWAHPLAVSATIEQIRNQIERDAAEKASVPVTGRGGVVIDTLERRRERADQAAEHAWTKYLDDYREQERLTFQTRYQTELQTFDQSDIAPLAQAQANWLKHNHMCHYFEANFDPTDPESGAVYTATVSLALGGGQDKEPVSIVLGDWFKGSLTDKTNLLLRGLVLNQDSLAQALHEAAKPQYTDWKQYPWDQMTANVNQALGRVLEGKADYVGVLLKQSFGALSQALKQAAQSGRLRL